jgi:hypothetical protein
VAMLTGKAPSMCTAKAEEILQRLVSAINEQSKRWNILLRTPLALTVSAKLEQCIRKVITF